MAKNWLITGVSSGIGRALAQVALDRGDAVTGTLRNAAQLADFEALAPGRAIALQLDVTDRAGVKAKVPAAIEAMGGIDVLVNNAGFGVLGALEEFDDEDIDRCIDTNLGGTIALIRAVLPAMRSQKRGDIVNFSSMAGFMGVPGMTPYNAAKYAVSGLSEGLALELAPLGIRVMAVEPAGFRTEFALGSLKVANNQIADYANTPAGLTRTMLGNYGGHEHGDPVRLSNILCDMLDGETLPSRWVCGGYAISSKKQLAQQAIDMVMQWETQSAATDFPA